MSSKKRRIVNNKCWRIIPSRYPTTNLFERVTSSEDMESVFEIESLTNDRLRQEMGDLSLVAENDRIAGPNTNYIMAAFTHLNSVGSRFSDGSWGVYYASLEFDTCVEETKYHREKFLSYTKEDPIHLDMRVLIANINGELHDFTLPEYMESQLYSLNDYSYSQEIARQLKAENSEGIYYHSVRKAEGKNVAVFKPKLLSNCIQERHLEYVWDGQKISAIFEKKIYG